MRLSKGVITAYDATNHKADVLLVGSMSRVLLRVPVAYQVAPEQVAEDTPCGVVFFGEGDAGLVICTFDEVPVPPLDLDAFGPKLDIYDVMRGHQDDFFGRALHPAYQIELNNGVIDLPDGEHGGRVRLRAYTGVTNWAVLWLGDNLGGYDTLRADEGWVMLAEMEHSDSETCTLVFGAMDSTKSQNRIWAGNFSGTWRLRCTSGGADTTVSSGISVDVGVTQLHALDVYPTATGRQADYYLDGALIASVDTNVPTVPMTPSFYTYNGDASDAKEQFCNFVRVIPRFLG